MHFGFVSVERKKTVQRTVHSVKGIGQIYAVATYAKGNSAARRPAANAKAKSGLKGTASGVWGLRGEHYVRSAL